MGAGPGARSRTVAARLAGACLALLLQGAVAAQSFTDVTDAAGLGGIYLPSAMDHVWGIMVAGVAVADYDGDLDLVQVNGYYQAPPSLDLLAQYETDRLRVFENDSTGVFTERAAAFGIDDPDQARGLPDQVEVLQCGNNYLSSAPLGLWFGLGTAASATVTVRWPGGTISAHAVAADRRLILTEPSPTVRSSR